MSTLLWAMKDGHAFDSGYSAQSLEEQFAALTALKQVAIIRDAYRPDAATLDWARAVLAAAEGERGVFRFQGRMVDEPVLRHARAVLSRA